MIWKDGAAAFVSHQWLSGDHPDPDGRQMRVLQVALKRILSGEGSVPLDIMTEGSVPNARPMAMREFQMEALFIWYDYFSVPQMEQHSQGRAIQSIPAYVAQCRFFFALCPAVESHWYDKVLTASTWSQRGWCRVERAARELSHDSWILLQSETSMELVGTAISFGTGCVGEGDFTVSADRQKLAPVVRGMVLEKLRRLLQEGDLPGFRRHLNLESTYLRGLEIEPIDGFLTDRDPDPVCDFLLQNGFRKPSEADRSGWPVLHYAALAGKVTVLQGLLDAKSSVNRRTSKDEPRLGFPPWMSALDLALFFRHHEAAQLLLAARAHLQGGFLSAMNWAAQSGSAEGVRMVCEAGGRPLAPNMVGTTPLAIAAGYGALQSVQELVLQSDPDQLNLSRALHAAAGLRGGSQVVRCLLDLRADVDFQWSVPRDLAPVGRMIFTVKSCMHSLGSTSLFSAFAYHMHGSTPLMQALRTSQHEVAAVLLAAGARLEIRNARSWTAADFGQGSIPSFLEMGFSRVPIGMREGRHFPWP